jgi:sulfide:quinone oxidoreductase
MSARSYPPLRVIVYGGDLAALETALALRERCEGRCSVMLLSPVRDLPVRTHGCGASAAGGRGARFDLEALAAERGLGFRSDAVVAVDPAAREAKTITGTRLRYDALVIAFGARPRGAIAGVTTCWGAADVGALETLAGELRSGAVGSVAFAIEAGNRWTLPTYELALTAARFAHRDGIEEARLSVVTYESEPVELIGRDASRALGQRLADAGIDLHTESEPVAFEEGSLLLRGGRRLEVDRAVAMYAVDGPRIGGLPRDAEGFLPVDDFGRVKGAPGIWAAGEVTSYPVRQAGLAAQQARVVAASIASEAGAEVSAEPFRPVLRGLLRAGAELATDPILNGNGNGNGAAAGAALLWWPPDQLAGEHVSEQIAATLEVRPPDHADSIPVRVELGPDGRRVAAGAS